MSHYNRSALSIFFTMALFICPLFLTSVVGARESGPSDGGGGGGERLSTPAEIRQALQSVYGNGNFPLQYLGTYQEAANRNQLPTDMQVQQALLAVFNKPGNFRLEGDGDRHADIKIVLRSSCMHDRREHLASNRRIGTNAAGLPQWEICYNLSELQKYSPSSLISVIIPLHFHEQTEIEGFSHQTALRVQESVRYRMLLSQVISTAQALINLSDDLLPGGYQRDQHWHVDSELTPEQEAERRRRELWMQAGRLTMEWVQLIQAGIIPSNLLNEKIDLSHLKFSERQQLAQRFGAYVQFCRGRTGLYSLNDEAVVQELLKQITLRQLTAYFENTSSFSAITHAAQFSEGRCQVEGLTPDVEAFWSGTGRALQSGVWKIIQRIEERVEAVLGSSE